MAKHDPDLSRVFHALSDPTRRAIVAALAQRPLPVTALARPTGLSLPTVLKHLACLEEAALVVTEKQGRTRICRLHPAPLAVAEGWLGAQRTEWEARTDRLESYALALMKEART
ncbi:ArsR family transcriptional regulator [Aliigemmobacter aestuarii]|uniref:ArsR family transcriptional regulator n=1 Tax=Aliigemmobacter aestuarii TaxID=1445661 RepID=A0A4S3MKE9_9RHOB|nr:metalloregulator ArsR/SmtB family transcription factor [Gemmobacter aestuarii]THD82223.1 ArsR family transcriptional regulator [Gemmobacter aestuarii]